MIIRQLGSQIVHEVSLMVIRQAGSWIVRQASLMLIRPIGPLNYSPIMFPHAYSTNRAPRLFTIHVSSCLFDQPGPLIVRQSLSMIVHHMSLMLIRHLEEPSCLFATDYSPPIIRHRLFARYYLGLLTIDSWGRSARRTQSSEGPIVILVLFCVRICKEGCGLSIYFMSDANCKNIIQLIFNRKSTVFKPTL